VNIGSPQEMSVREIVEVIEISGRETLRPGLRAPIHDGLRKILSWSAPTRKHLGEDC